jgi:GNAT superfamily N-acetyltransferase
VTVRLAAVADYDAVVRIEQAAGEQFRELGMDAIADDEPIAREPFEALTLAGGALVWEVNGVPVGYLLLDEVDAAAHVEQLSVDPAFGRRGVGSALLAVAADWAAKRGLGAITLTTFRDVPWNAGFYARRGFLILIAAEHGPELTARIRQESTLGLDRWPRVAMRRALA